MVDQKETRKRRWIDIKNDFKKSWDRISNEDPEIIEDDNTQNDKFNTIDSEEGFKKSRSNFYYSSYE